MPEIRGEQRHPGRDVTTVAIPAKQRLDSKRVAQIVHPLAACRAWSACTPACSSSLWNGWQIVGCAGLVPRVVRKKLRVSGCGQSRSRISP